MRFDLDLERNAVDDAVDDSDDVDDPDEESDELELVDSSDDDSSDDDSSDDDFSDDDSSDDDSSDDEWDAYDDDELEEDPDEDSDDSNSDSDVDDEFERELKEDGDDLVFFLTVADLEDNDRELAMERAVLLDLTELALRVLDLFEERRDRKLSSIYSLVC